MMGVKDLWITLAPVCEKKSLWELRNQVVAVDLSVWICENQTVDYSNSNLYLRNLFFRTSYMLLLGIKPIFVLEGNAPELKHGTMKQRKEIQSKSKDIKIVKPELGSRQRLKSLQKQCEELLKYVGVSCIHSNGEAEALCAALNRDGIVDGVITKDSDCFLYGARAVFRNFNISANGGTFEKYDMKTIEDKLHLGRHKMIALSLLCGCDYNKNGVDGIGKETALKFLSTVEELDVLDRLTKWCENANDLDVSSKIESNIRRKAIKNPKFPFLDVQNEFLNYNYDLSNISYEWKQPNIQNFVMFVGRKLGWTTDYAYEKFLPLVSRWHLLHDKHVNILTLDYIVKKRTLRCIPCLEVKWKDFEYTTVEPMSFLKIKYGSEIDDFERSKIKRKKTPKKRKKNVLVDLKEDLLTSMSTKMPAFHDESITVSDFECSASDLLELSAIVESIVSRQ